MYIIVTVYLVMLIILSLALLMWASPATVWARAVSTRFYPGREQQLNNLQHRAGEKQCCFSLNPFAERQRPGRPEALALAPVSCVLFLITLKLLRSLQFL